MKPLFNAVAFLVGILSLGLLRELPTLVWFYFLTFLGLLTIRYRHWLLCCALLGHAWAGIDSHNYFSSILPYTQQRNDFLVEGRVVSFPVLQADRVSFQFEIKQILEGDLDWQGGRVRLSWRMSDALPTLGERWRFQVRLFPPTGMLNAAGFDYERWLFSENLVASGYVRSQAKRLAKKTSLLQSWRRDLAQQIKGGAGYTEARGLVAALLLGDRSGLKRKRRENFQLLGLSHLLAISGLHVGLMAVLFWSMASFSWSRSVRLMRYYPAPLVGALAAICGALMYALLAGLSIPTQRALVMTLAFAGTSLLRIHYSPLDRFSIALVLILIIDPRSVWKLGFWFSFCSVLLLILLAEQKHKFNVFTWTLSAQFLIWLLMLPLQAVAGLPLSWVSPLMNLVAIPWFGFVLVPWMFFAIFLLQWGWELPFIWLLQTIAVTLSVLDPISAWAPHLNVTPPGLIPLILSVLSVYLLTKARRLYIIISLLVLYSIAWLRSDVSNFALRLTFFDVGQGESVLVETAHHRLLYDLGPRFTSGFSATEGAVIPYLKALGVKKLDRLILSHNDRDHTGNAQALLDIVPATQILLGQPVDSLKYSDQEFCQTGMHWEWDGIEFTILNPPSQNQGASDNDMSCVLLLEYAGKSLLLTGDVTSNVERHLLQLKQFANLELVKVAHHGSRSSSSKEFVAQTKPRYAVVSAGWINSYEHPHAEVVQRWQASGALVLNTAATGMLSFTWQTLEQAPEVTLYRREHGHFWNR